MTMSRATMLAKPSGSDGNGSKRCLQAEFDEAEFDEELSYLLARAREELSSESSDEADIDEEGGEGGEGGEEIGRGGYESGHIISDDASTPKRAIDSPRERPNETAMAFRRREVKAAKERLAAAGAQASSAAKMIAVANAMADAAREMANAAERNKGEARSILQRSQGEVEEAKAILKEAEDRWGVIDVDGSDGEDEEKARCTNKKRKGAPAAVTVVQPTAAATASSAGGATDVETIFVEGAGNPEVNGTYRLVKFQLYSKCGWWGGNAATFFVHRLNVGLPYWRITCEWYGGSSRSCYNSVLIYRCGTSGSNLPPKDGWEPCIYHGALPAPRLEYASRDIKKRKGAPAAAEVVQSTAATRESSADNATGPEEVVVKGAGSSEVNGTYRRWRTDGGVVLPTKCSSNSIYPVYSKGGSWKGASANFFLSLQKNCKRWRIACADEIGSEGSVVFLYKSSKTAPVELLPPKTQWGRKKLHGTLPPPQLEW